MDKLNTVTESRSVVPLHRRISDELRAQIDAGTIAPGDMVPSEHELMQRYAVSRGTVRQALASLRADGTISGSQGRQLSVRGSHLTQPITELVSFTSWVQSLGKRPGSSLLSFKRRNPDGETRSMLDLTVGSTVYLVERLRLADEEPLMIERTLLPEHLGRLLEEVDLERNSIFAALERSGVVFASARHTISALPADRVDAQLLGVSVRTPLLRVRRRAFSLSGEPLEWADDRYLGDKVDFTLENSATRSGLSRRLE
jgi:GntR family transcriptional regulator